MANVYIKSFSESDEQTIVTSLESLIVINIFRLCNGENVTLNILKLDRNSSDEPLFQIKAADICCSFIEQVPSITGYCSWPIVVVGNTVIAGLASVCRQIIKSSDKEDVRKYLGFRGACLMACSESSIWTRFCEIDMIRTVNSIFKNLETYVADCFFPIPTDLTRFENHMQQAVKVHNVYKLARIKNNDKLIKSNVPIEQLNLDHKYAEGPFITLSDVVLFSCFNLILTIFDVAQLTTELPLSIKWYKNILVDLKSILVDYTVRTNIQLPLKHFEMSQKAIAKQSLYTSDPKRYKPQNRTYTKQSDIEKSLAILAKITTDLADNQKPFGYDSDFSWSEIPLGANPLGGALPNTRADRKCQQLENLAKATVKLAGNETNTIVDFCTGSGHLGILVASLLPKSHLILVENKEKSLQRACERITKLNLTNVTLVQSNLDYFVAAFDIGLALHACGVATDLVIQKCIENNANFVCCPCCYGAIHDCHHLEYPRSLMFKNLLTYRDYLVIGHSADQTHDKDNVKTAQGYLCMNIIDVDRKLYAEQSGYSVHLGKLIPHTCTPKNNLLVGLYDSA